MLPTMPEGLYEPEELALLRATAAKAPRFPFLEISVFKGRSANVLSATLTPYLILCGDLSMGDFRAEWPPHDAFFKDVHEAVAAAACFGLVHHDADHTLETTYEHLVLVMPKIVTGGFLCIHDFDDPAYPDVVTAMKRAEHESRTTWVPVQHAGHLYVFTKG